MTDTMWNVVLYPALADGLSETQREFLTILSKKIDGLNHDKFQHALSHRVTLEDIQESAAQIPQDERNYLYFLAKQIAAIDGLSEPEKRALIEIQSIIGVEKDDLELKPPVPKETSTAEEPSFEEISSRYCKIAAISSFIPLPLISDAFILVPIQARMVKKISDLYKYPIHAKEFVKMIIERAGPEYASAIAGRMAISLVPVVGWLAAAGITYGVTYAIALITREYIEQRGQISTATIRSLYKKAYREGRHEFESIKAELKRDEAGLLKKFKELSKDNSLIKKIQQRFNHHKNNE